jgi:hypothetical protein
MKNGQSELTTTTTIQPQLIDSTVHNVRKRDMNMISSLMLQNKNPRDRILSQLNRLTEGKNDRFRKNRARRFRLEKFSKHE